MQCVAQAMGPEAKICVHLLFGILGRATAFREKQSSHYGVNLIRLLIEIETQI